MDDNLKNEQDFGVWIVSIAKDFNKGHCMTISIPLCMFLIVNAFYISNTRR